MEDIFDQIIYLLNAFWEYFRNIIDILFVAFAIYWGYVFISKTRAIQLLKGIGIIIVVSILSRFLQLNTLNWLLEKLALYGVIAIIILFQPELRRLITQFGQRNWITSDSRGEAFPLDEVVNAVNEMAEEKIGALIVIERNTGLKGYTESGVTVDSAISEEVIRTIFYPLTPLHDGAIIIQHSRIASAACYLPLSDSKQLKKYHGARHRAGLGIAEETDALVIVASEETGNVSIMANGKIFSKIKGADLKNMILYFMNPKTAYEENYKLK